MPLIFYCPRRHLLSVDPSVSGKRVRCPMCNEVMIAPPASAVVSETAIPIPPPPMPPPVTVENFAFPRMELPAPTPPPIVIPAPEAESSAIQLMELAAPTPPMVLPAPEQDMPEAPIPQATLAPPEATAPLSPTVLSTTLPLAPPVVPSDLPDGAQRQKKSATTDEDQGLFEQFLPKLTKRQQLERLNLGLALHYWKYLAVLVGNLLLQASLILTTMPFLVLVGFITLFLGFLVNIAAPVLGLTGSFLCGTAPTKIGGRVFIVTSFCFDALATALTLSSAVAALFTRNPVQANVFAAFLYLAVLANLAGFILFMLFLHRLAHFFKDVSTAHEIVTIIVTLIFLMLGGPLATVFAAAMFAAMLGPESALVIVCFGLLGIVAVYLQLLFRILNVISTLRARI